MTDPPIVTGAELATALGGRPDQTLCDLCAGTASDATAVLVDPAPRLEDGTVDPAFVWPDGVHQAGLLYATDLFRATVAQGGGYSLDEFTFANDFRMATGSLRRYETLLAPSRAVGGMVS